MEIFEKWLKTIGFLLVLLVINSILNYLTIVYSEPHRFQNYELKKNRENYNVIAFGASDCRRDFDPETATNLLGKECFNYGQTEIKYESGGVESCYDNALFYQKPEICIFFFPYENLNENKESIQAYGKTTVGMSNKVSKLKYYIKASMDEGAIERIFQWSYNILEYEDIKDVLNNLKKKLKGGWHCDKKWYRNTMSNNYKGRGWFPSEKKERLLHDIELKPFLEESFSTEETKALQKLLKRCDEEQIKCYVVIGTYDPSLILVDTISYDFAKEAVGQIAETNNATFIDMNMVKKEYYRVDDYEMENANHLNREGAEKMTEMLAYLIKKDMSGERIDDYFYTMGEYRDSY